MKNDIGLEAFRKDLQEVQYRNINRFPTLIFRRSNSPSLIITGYRPYSALVDIMQQIAPDIAKVQQAANAEEYINYWGSITSREVAEAVVTNSQI